MEEDTKVTVFRHFVTVPPSTLLGEQPRATRPSSSAYPARRLEDAPVTSDLPPSVLARIAWRARRGHKECSRCHRPLPVSAFSRDSSRSDGLRRYCRSCDGNPHSPGPLYR